MISITRAGWTLDEALTFIRELQSVARIFRMHLALAGSVLNDGSSSDDLDIIVMSLHTNDEPDWDAFSKYLGKMGSFAQKTGEQYINADRTIFNLVLPNNQKIDFFRYGMK